MHAHAYTHNGRLIGMHRAMRSCIVHHTHMCTHKYTYTHAHTQIHMHTHNTQIHTHNTQIHMLTHKYTCTHITHTNTHNTQIPMHTHIIHIHKYTSHRDHTHMLTCADHCHAHIDHIHSWVSMFCVYRLSIFGFYQTQVANTQRKNTSVLNMYRLFSCHYSLNNTV
jgi:hypothetical protein